jgi:hypothetical protein
MAPELAKTLKLFVEIEHMSDKVTINKEKKKINFQLKVANVL